MPERIENLYTYVCDDVRYKRKDNPDAWTTVKHINGQMFASYPFFEFIPGAQGPEEPKRYGDFVIDIDTGEMACGAAIQIVNWFEQVYGIESDQWRVYLSGKKGVHLELPAEILGTEDGHKLLPVGYKHLAKEIEGELGIKIDTSMYNRGSGKPYRQPNVMRDIGTCKRQIEFDALQEILDEEDYRAACSEPGPVWQPENTAVCKLLADKLQAYLKEAEQHQEVIQHQRTLSDDEIDRLSLTVPQCISTLAKLTSAERGNTFNDVAMQLTAYAITSGKSEEEFLAGCKVFIENYPSTSLNTLEKRYQNCRDRYRTMAANGNQHSCGGVLALGVAGFKCDECKAKPASGVHVDVMSADDLRQATMTTIIPPHLLRPGGLIDLGMDGLSQPGLPDIPQYNLPVVLTTIANAVAGKITCCGVWPNVYNIKIGPTSTGKSTSDEAVKTAIINAGVRDFYGCTDFASGPALMRALMDLPVCMVVIDEATSIFRRYSGRGGDAIADGKRDALLEIFSSSGRRIEKAYSDNKKTIIVERPCLSLTGNATSVVLDEIKQEDFDTGTLQRFDFWCYEGDALERGIRLAENAHLGAFVDGIKAIQESNPTGGNLSWLTGATLDVWPDDHCRPIMMDFSRDVIRESNWQVNDGDKGIVSRKFHLALKYAMVHLAATRAAEEIGEPLTEKDLLYGIGVANLLAQWKLTTLRGRVLTGEFHRQCEVFKSAIASAVRNGKRATFKVMAHRRPELKNWRRKDSDEVISILVKRGEVVLDESKRPTAYLLAKKEEL